MGILKRTHKPKEKTEREEKALELFMKKGQQLREAINRLVAEQKER